MMEWIRELDASTKAVASFLGAATVIWGVHRKVWPPYSRWRSRMGVVVDTLVGADAITDPVSGSVLKPATPGIGHRMATLEEAVALMASNDHRITHLEERMTVVESVIESPK